MTRRVLSLLVAALLALRVLAASAQQPADAPPAESGWSVATYDDGALD